MNCKVSPGLRGGRGRREGNYKERGCKGEGRANPRIAQAHCTLQTGTLHTQSCCTLQTQAHSLSLSYIFIIACLVFSSLPDFYFFSVNGLIDTKSVTCNILGQDQYIYVAKNSFIKGLASFTQLVKVRMGKLVLALPSIRF